MTLPDTPPAGTPEHTRDDTDRPRYRDASASIDDRVADLLGRMTLEEKLAQLGSAWIFQLAGHDGLDLDRAAPLLEHGIGQVTRLSGASSFGAADSAAHANAIQRHLAEHTRLGIPAIVHEEICSGLMAREATAFPQAIGVAASFRPEHNREMADQIRRQMRAVGAHQGLSPVLDICRDARWGRLEETYGEDPFLVSAMGVEFVRGLQGDDLRSGVAATAKHLVGYGASEGGMNWAPAHLPERELRDVYLRPFEAAVRDAGLASIMNGYHELDGIPCGANEWLFDTVLRGEWGFDGTVVSDYFAVKQLFEYHHVADDPGEAAVTALSTGIDVELPGTDCYGGPLRAAVDAGRIDVAVVDRAVARVVAAKFQLGLFEQADVDEAAVSAEVRTGEQLALADRVAADSLVLLSNDGALPLPPTAKVAVIGPHAIDPRLLFGDYSYLAHVESLIEVLRSGRNVFAMPLEHGVDVEQEGAFEHVPTPLDAIRERLDSDVSYTRGCEVTDRDRSGFDAAVAAASAADVAVLVLGERSGLTDDCTTGESRDVASLDLPGVQEDLVHAVAATGTPVVLVLIAGRPIGSPAVHDAASAVLMAWLPGERGGPAIADALVGAAVPGGKLPVSYPRSSGQIPVFYAHKVSGGRSHWKGEYVDLSNEPLYPFGHGLSYTTFSIVPDEVEVSAASGDVVDVAATVTNTGDRAGDEVVQLYATDPVASVTRPVRELVGFARVSLGPGASTRVVFALPIDGLGFAGRDDAYAIEPGRIDLAVGSSSTDLTPAGSIEITGATRAAVRAFATPVRLEAR
jgi:beta-glucosidase